MKQLIYSKDFNREVLDSGIYRDFRYCIVSIGPHPCAYIENKTPFKDIDEADTFLNVHGGVTFFGRMSFNEDGSGLVDCIGWDYAHLTDYSPICELPDTKRWTTEEILVEVKRAIDSLYSGKVKLS